MFINKQEIYFRPNSSLYRSIYLGFRANVNTELYGEVVSCLQIKGNVISSVGNSSTVDIHLVSDAEVHCILSSATSARVQVPRCALLVACTRRKADPPAHWLSRGSVNEFLIKLCKISKDNTEMQSAG